LIDLDEDHEAARSDEVLVYLTLELFDRGGSGGDFSDRACNGLAALGTEPMENFIEA
jgi:hypothetical protein